MQIKNQKRCGIKGQEELLDIKRFTEFKIFFSRCRYFIFTSFWAYKIYYVYGFMLLVFIILAIVTVCVTIVCTYFLLNAEDYRWLVLPASTWNT